MKYLIITVGFLTGCANNPFQTQHLERFACHGFTTPWANYVERGSDSVAWGYNKYNSRRRYRDIPNAVPCFKEVMSQEQLARWNGN
jgi:hypothetical protein